MSYGITVSCAGPALDDFTDQLDLEEIDCEIFNREPAVACAAAGEMLDVAESAAPYPAVIGTFIVWLKARMESAGAEVRCENLLS
jgi:hypothetical protein